MAGDGMPAEALANAERERDEARVEVERLRARLERWEPRSNLDAGDTR